MFGLLTFAFLVVSSPVTDESVLTINTPHDNPISTKTSDGFVDRIVTEALERTGHRIRIVHLPAERALINANRGIDDGVLHRVAGLNRTYHNLVQVTESTSIMSFVAFTNQSGVRVRDWDSLRPYSVGIITGWKILEKNIPAGTEVIKVKNPEQLFSLLEHRRIDVILYGKWQGLKYLKDHRLTGVRMLQPALAEEKMYVYFNKKHRNLIPGFSSALRSMKSDGSWKRIYRETLEPLNQ